MASASFITVSDIITSIICHGQMGGPRPISTNEIQLCCDKSCDHMILAGDGLRYTGVCVADGYLKLGLYFY